MVWAAEAGMKQAIPYAFHMDKEFFEIMTSIVVLAPICRSERKATLGWNFRTAFTYVDPKIVASAASFIVLADLQKAREDLPETAVQPASLSRSLSSDHPTGMNHTF